MENKLIDFRVNLINEESQNESQQIMIVMRDISLEKELQRERAMQRYSEIMFASISHELRTPINVIINCM